MKISSVIIINVPRFWDKMKIDAEGHKKVEVALKRGIPSRLWGSVWAYIYDGGKIVCKCMILRWAEAGLVICSEEEVDMSVNSFMDKGFAKFVKNNKEIYNSQRGLWRRMFIKTEAPSNCGWCYAEIETEEE